jgi:uncharacterized membrane protein YqiK
MTIVILLLFFLLLAGAGYLWWRWSQRIPGNMVGVVVKEFGGSRSDDDPLVRVLGSRGVQAGTLPPNSARWLPPFLYKVLKVPLTFVPNGTVGLVVAKAGRVPQPGHALARHVDCDYFQDGEWFIRNGGERGRQQQMLTGGYYAINTGLFDVITVDTADALAREGLTPDDLREIAIPIGETGVVITHAGNRPGASGVGPRVPDHQDFQLPWMFLGNGGQKGVQEETLDEGGRYLINPWFGHVVRIPTRVLVLEWTRDEKSSTNLDASLGQVVLDVQGHTVRLEMKQTVQIPVTAAPSLIRRFGTLGASGLAPVQQFVDKELGATVAGYFRRISARYRIQEFITRYDEVCNELAAEVRQALAKTGVVAVNTTLEEFVCDEPEINQLRRKIAVQQEQVKLEETRLDELNARRMTETVQDEIDLQKIRVEKERRKLEFVEIETLVDLLGADHMKMERALAEWVKADVPQVISGDGNIAQSLLQLMPFTQARDMLMAMANDASKNPQLPAPNGQNHDGS